MLDLLESSRNLLQFKSKLKWILAKLKFQQSIATTGMLLRQKLLSASPFIAVQWSGGEEARPVDQDVGRRAGGARPPVITAQPADC